MIYELRKPIVLDYESFYSDTCSVKPNRKTGWVGGPWHYTRHKEFYAYMASFYDLETNECGVVERDNLVSFTRSLQGRTIVAHNVLFDLSVAQSLVPGFTPFNTFDTADAAAYLQSGRSLLVACKVLLDRDLDKSARDFMKGKHFADLGVEEKQRIRDYALSDAKNEADLFRYCVDKWPALEQWMSSYTLKQNIEGLHIDTNYLEEQVDKVSSIRSAAVAKIPWVQDIDTDKPLSAKQLALYCREVGILPPESLAEDAESCQAWEAQYGEQFPVVGAIRDFRKSNTYFKKLVLMQNLVRPDGTMPLGTKYAAAEHTLRWSATGMNYQSLPRPEPDGTYKFADLRGCIVPASGCKFVGSDLSGIEARILPYLAGDMDYLKQVERLDKQAAKEGLSGGGDIYDPACRRMFGYSDSRPLKKADKDLRNATKVCVLQLGYQSGAKKFHWYISNNVDKRVLDRVRQGTESDEQLATRLVRLYRSMNPKVTQLWFSLDQDLRTACTAGDDFRVQQPNGRIVHYRGLAIRASIKPDGTVRNEVVGSVCRGEDMKTNLYGGKITENLCQEGARHVLVHSIYNLESAGYPTKFSVHDENVVQISEERANRQTTLEIEEIMSTRPSWARDLPLAAETAILDRYSK